MSARTMRSLKPFRVRGHARARAHVLRSVIGLCVLITLFGVGGINGISPQPIRANANANGQAPAITFIPIFTPTRTPTPVNFGNLVWNDLDGDGLQDIGEPGLSGVTVQLWNDAKNSLIDNDISDANGHYTLTSPGPGNYRIRALLPNTLDQFTVKDAGDDQKDSDINNNRTDFGFTDVYPIGSNVISITSIDIGIKKFMTPTPTRTPTPVNFGNLVWDDLDGDGLQDIGEPGLSGVTVQLWNDAKNSLIDNDISDANGHYTLTSPGPGNYRIRALLPVSGDQFTVKDAGTDQEDSDINNSGADFGFTDIYPIGSNVISITSIDIGIKRFVTPTPTRTPTPINIGNFIWADDGDGVQEAGEVGLANVTLRLWNAGTNQVVDTAVSNSNGNYTLVAPFPGNYRIEVLLGIGNAFAPKDIGADNQKDSDCNTDGINLGFTDVFNIASNVISTNIYDCGLLGPYATATATATPTQTPTSTFTPTPTLTSTPIQEPTSTFTPTPTLTFIPEFWVFLPLAQR